MTKPTHRLISMRAENTKRIQLFDMEFTDDALVLTGENFVGKSSACDALIYALAGEGTHPPTPIRTGQKNADVNIVIEETATHERLLVHRHWTPKTSTLTIRPAINAEPLPSPQTILNNIIGRIAFDPTTFSRMKSKEQWEVLIDLLDIRDQIREIQARRKVLFDERTDANRRAKNLKAVLASLEIPKEGLPEKKSSNEKVIAGIQAAQAVTKENDAARAVLQANISEVKLCRDRMEAADKEKEDLIERMKAVREKIAKLETAADEARVFVQKQRAITEKLTDPDTTELSEKLTEIANINNKIDDATKYRDTEAEMKAATTAGAELTSDIAKLDQDQIDLIKGADLPLPELGLTDDYVTYEGLPLSQAGGAKNMRVSVKIAMALNPKLGFLILEEVGGLDKKQLRMICEMAKEGGYQLLMTRPDYNGEIPHVVISEGLIVDGEFEVVS